MPLKMDYLDTEAKNSKLVIKKFILTVFEANRLHFVFIFANDSWQRVNFELISFWQSYEIESNGDWNNIT